MKKLFVVLFALLIIIPNVFAANSQSSNASYEYATVNTDPGALATDVYGTNEINPKYLSKVGTSGATNIWFSIGGSGVMTVTLQFKRLVDSAWIDYEDYASNNRLLLEDRGHGVIWRAIVKGTNYTSGTKIFGFDW